MLDHKVFTFFNELYKTLKQQDVEILKHFNCDEVSDNDYFFYGISSDIISNSLHILINYLSGNIESAGVDTSCRTILEALTIIEMNKNGEITHLQKKIYRYSYAYVDLDNFHAILTNEMKDSPELQKVMADKETCKDAILKHFGCTPKDLKKRDIFIDDPCFYLKKDLSTNIKFSKLLKKYFPKNKQISELYEFFSLFIHPRCEINPQAEESIMEIRKIYINIVLDIVHNYLKNSKLLSTNEGITDFNDDFFNNPLLRNNVHNIKQIELGINLIKKELCFLPNGEDAFTWFFLEKIRYLLIDMETSLSLGYKEHVIACFKPFIELFSVFFEVNSVDINEFDYIKKGYWISSRLQIIEHFKTLEIKFNINEYEEELKNLYENYYKDKYGLVKLENFVDKLQHNSLYFLSNQKKSFNKMVRSAIENIFASDKKKSINAFTLYRLSKDMGHASGYNFNATTRIIDTSCHKVLLTVYTCLLYFLVNAGLTLEEHKLKPKLRNIIEFIKLICEEHSKTLEQQYKKFKLETETHN